MKRLLLGVAIAGMAIVAINIMGRLDAQTMNTISPAQGFPSPAFITVCPDTPRVLPAGNRGGGIVDTLNRKTARVTITPKGKAARYCTGGTRPTRYFQVFDTLKSLALDTLSGTGFIVNAGHGFRDSMYVTVKNTGHSDGTYLVKKAAATRVVVDRAYAADTFGTKDSILTPSIGTKWFANQTRTFWTDEIPKMYYENYDSGQACTLDVDQGWYQN